MPPTREQATDVLSFLMSSKDTTLSSLPVGRLAKRRTRELFETPCIVDCTLYLHPASLSNLLLVVLAFRKRKGKLSYLHSLRCTTSQQSALWTSADPNRGSGKATKMSSFGKSDGKMPQTVVVLPLLGFHLYFVRPPLRCATIAVQVSRNVAISVSSICRQEGFPRLLPELLQRFFSQLYCWDPT